LLRGAVAGIGCAEILWVFAASQPSHFVLRSEPSRRRIDEFGNTDCDCGASLAFEVDPLILSPLEEARLRTQCIECGKAFDVSTLPATYRRFVEARLTGVPRCEVPLLGGANSRLAIAIWCGKDVPLPREHPMPKLCPDFMNACSQALGCDLYEVWDENC
jgi:hypothetical protein